MRPLYRNFCLGLVVTFLLTSALARAQPVSAVPTPADRKAYSSLAPDIALEDVTNTLRPAFLRSATVSPHDPNVAYLSSWDGYVWKTIDGGRTWAESRVIVETRPYFGDLGQRNYFGVHRSDNAERSFRHAPSVVRANLDLPLNMAWTRRPWFWVRGGLLADTINKAYNAPPSPAGGVGSTVNLGIGLPGGAPRLQLLVRKLGKPTSGVNMKQTLVLRGARPTEIRIIVIHPKDPNIVFGCSAFGLYRSSDAGANWVRVYTGTKPTDRFAFHLAVDPKDGNRVLLGSGDGLWYSVDGGNSFSRATQGGVGGGAIFWVYFDPYDPNYIFAGTDSGLLRSSDNGATWDYIYFTTFPAARVVTYVEIDPHDKKTGYITTADGPFTTPDILHGGLESWHRLGGLRFSGIVSEKIKACPKHKGHLWIYTNMYVRSVASGGVIDAGGAYTMESLDAGENWQVVYAGNTYGAMMWFDNDPKDPDLLWLVWSRSLTRMKRKTGAEALAKRTVIPDDPPIPDVIMAAQMYTGVDPGRQLDFRQRANWKALVPRVEASWTGLWTNRYMLQRSGLYPTLPFRYDEPFGTGRNEFRIFAYWNLGDLVFNLDRTNFGRIDRLTYEIRELNLRVAIHRLYGELRRLRVLMANDPPKDLRIRLLYKVRMEELASYVNFMTGNYLTYWWQGGRTRGVDAKWWEPFTEKVVNEPPALR